MPTNREEKEFCYKEALKDSLVSVEMVLNHVRQLNGRQGEVENKVLRVDKMRTILNLELVLTTYCVLLRKMAENQFITLTNEMKTDVNSIIHSTKFEYEDRLVVYSIRGKEEVNLLALIKFGNDYVTGNNQFCRQYSKKK